LEDPPLLLPPPDDPEREGLDFGEEEWLGGLNEELLGLFGGLDFAGVECFMLDWLLLSLLLGGLTGSDFFSEVRLELGT